MGSFLSLLSSPVSFATRGPCHFEANLNLACSSSSRCFFHCFETNLSLASSSSSRGFLRCFETNLSSLCSSSSRGFLRHLEANLSIARSLLSTGFLHCFKANLSLACSSFSRGFLRHFEANLRLACSPLSKGFLCHFEANLGIACKKGSSSSLLVLSNFSVARKCSSLHVETLISDAGHFGGNKKCSTSRCVECGFLPQGRRKFPAVQIHLLVTGTHTHTHTRTHKDIWFLSDSRRWRLALSYWVLLQDREKCYMKVRFYCRTAGWQSCILEYRLTRLKGGT